MTMLANALSHTILIGIVAAFVWTQAHSFEGSFNGIVNETALLVSSFFMGILTTFFTELLARGIGLQEDASTGVVFTSLFAVGVIAVTLLTRDAHIGLEAVMGNADALQPSDLRMVAITLGINIAAILVFYRGFALTTFDPALARSFGVSTGFYSYFLMVLVSMTAITAFRAVGVLMVLAFFTGPPLTARLLAKQLHHTLLIALAYGIGAAIIGVALSRHLLTAYGLPLSTGGVVVCVIVALYLVTLCVSKLRISRDIRTHAEGN
jgi:manganese/zinc/iron transport system permease protein